MDVGSQISEITSAAMSGELEFFDALRKRLSLIKGLERHVLKNILEERVIPPKISGVYE
jgi:phosphoserine phosphatase